MPFRFIHAADVHLGFRQYGSDERYDDFARALGWLVQEVLERKADFLLLAGDLFHQRSIEPRTLLQATECLGQLRAAGIPVIAVEGNHDRPLYGDAFSWLDYLVESELLILLSPAYRAEGIELAPWDGREGAYVDLPCGARVIGARYYGASTARVVSDLCQALPRLPANGGPPGYTVLLLHAGLEGILDNYSATLTRSQLEPLRATVDYLALGHIHKPFYQDDWLHNPGSLETNSTAEEEWPDRGYLLVDVMDEPGNRPRHAVRRVRGRRRAFIRLRFDVAAHETPEALSQALAAYLRREATPQRVAERAVVELQLSGRLPFQPGDLDLAYLEGLVREIFSPVHALLRNGTSAGEADIAVDETLSRQELEIEVLRGLLEPDVRYRQDSERWAKLALRLKRLALEQRPPEEVIGELRADRPGAGEEVGPC